jgi:hypothetical protein
VGVTVSGQLQIAKVPQIAKIKNIDFCKRCVVGCGGSVHESLFPALSSLHCSSSPCLFFTLYCSSLSTAMSAGHGNDVGAEEIADSIVFKGFDGHTLRRFPMHHMQPPRLIRYTNNSSITNAFPTHLYGVTEIDKLFDSGFIYSSHSRTLCKGSF